MNLHRLDLVSLQLSSLVARSATSVAPARTRGGPAAR